MSEKFQDLHPDIAEYSKEMLFGITAHADNAVDLKQRSNDGKLWQAAHHDNLLMAIWNAESPDLSEIYNNPPVAGEQQRIVARYWYTDGWHSVNLWLQDPDSKKDTFCVVTRLFDNDKIWNGSSAGFDHGRDENEPTRESTQALINKIFPGNDLDENTLLVDQFRENIWRQIDLGADGFTREHYEKVFYQPSMLDSEQAIQNGFQVNVDLENRTHLQNKNMVARIAIRHTLFAPDYAGIYNGLLNQALTIEQAPEGDIVNVNQEVIVSLMNEPYIQDGKPLMVGDLNETQIAGNLPEKLNLYTELPELPDKSRLQWYYRLVTEPIQEDDLYPFLDRD